MRKISLVMLGLVVILALGGIASARAQMISSNNICLGDMDHNGLIEQRDINLFVPIYGLSANDVGSYFWFTFARFGDFNNDKIINIYDLSSILGALGSSC
jgi:hypothetical protein